MFRNMHKTYLTFKWIPCGARQFLRVTKADSRSSSDCGRGVEEAADMDFACARLGKCLLRVRLARFLAETSMKLAASYTFGAIAATRSRKRRPGRMLLQDTSQGCLARQAAREPSVPPSAQKRLWSQSTPAFLPLATETEAQARKASNPGRGRVLDHSEIVASRQAS